MDSTKKLFMNFVPAILVTMSSPYFTELRASWRRNRRKLLDTTEQLRYILEETRIDVYNQFSENQGKWKQLAKYTVDKKKREKSDKRILHESKVIGKRLKDAYATTGSVKDGQLLYYYPPSKPYAREHQEGGVVGNPRASETRKESEFEKRRKRAIRKRDTDLDLEYLRRFGGYKYL